MEQTFEARFLSARRAVIAARFQNLNDMQREGVLTTQGPLLLLAGAGSGKTTVLINRIANLIAFGEGSDSNEIPEYIAEEDVTYLEDYLKTRDPAMQQQAERLCALRPAAPWSILAITFTNKAANELKARLRPEGTGTCCTSSKPLYCGNILSHTVQPRRRKPAHGTAHRTEARSMCQIPSVSFPKLLQSSAVFPRNK